MREYFFQLIVVEKGKMPGTEFQRMYRVLVTTREMVFDRGYDLDNDSSLEDLALALEERAKTTLPR